MEQRRYICSTSLGKN